MHLRKGEFTEDKLIKSAHGVLLFSLWAATFIRFWTLFTSCPWQQAETGLGKQIQKNSFNDLFLQLREQKQSTTATK